ncbi:MAG: hypothetical protein HY939_00260 [Gammaproteobacteria bacterium]|nr:hypothetical protein [Gammaproteobacteria bacterium]
MININNFINGFSQIFTDEYLSQPWKITQNLSTILNAIILQLDDSFDIKDGIAIHKTAHIEKGVTLKAPIVINDNCFIAANTYLRGLKLACYSRYRSSRRLVSSRQTS